MGAGSGPPINPLSDGKVGRISFGTLVVGASLVVVFLSLDTLQFVLTGHESVLFQAVAKGASAISIAGLIGTLLVSYLKGKT